jgi:hypothetical protein
MEVKSLLTLSLAAIVSTSTMAMPNSQLLSHKEWVTGNGVASHVTHKMDLQKIQQALSTISDKKNDPAPKNNDINIMVQAFSEFDSDLHQYVAGGAAQLYFDNHSADMHDYDVMTKACLYLAPTDSGKMTLIACGYAADYVRVEAGSGYYHAAMPAVSVPTLVSGDYLVILDSKASREDSDSSFNAETYINFHV